MKITVLLAATLLLSACAVQSNPPLTLDQELSQTSSKEERKETLRLACLNEAEWPASIKKVRTTGRQGMQQRQKLKRAPEITEMKSLCRQMDDLTTADAEDKLQPKDLANMCAAIVKTKTEKNQAEHANRIQKICEEMTSQKIKTTN